MTRIDERLADLREAAHLDQRDDNVTLDTVYVVEALLLVVEAIERLTNATVNAGRG